MIVSRVTNGGACSATYYCYQNLGLTCQSGTCR